MSYSINDLLSHPDIKLTDHLKTVLTLTEEFLQEKPEEIRNILYTPAKVIAVTHDVGKATLYFQEYIRKIRKKSNLTNHALLSSVIAYGLTKYCCPNDKVLPYLAFITVIKHHGDLCNVYENLFQKISENKNFYYLNIQEQFKTLNQDILTFTQNLLNINRPLIITFEQIENWFNEIIDKRNLIYLVTQNKDSKNFLLLNTLFSLLIDSDKLHAGVNTFSYKRNYFDVNINVNKKTETQKEIINQIRNKSQAEIDSLNYDELIKNRIFSINLPTGAGKTIASLKFAFNLKKTLREKKGENYRIIYSLPFLSIVEQTFKVIENILRDNGIPTCTNNLLKHHHLVEIKYNTDNEYFYSDEANLLIESWNSEIIVTTFYQLFHTLFTNSNSNMKKFHKISRSIIILDEIQALPPEYWNLISYIFTVITEYLDCYLVVLTATEPYLFEDAVSLIKNKHEYFNQINRYEINVNIENSITIDNFIDNFKLDKNKRYLFVLNTIKSSQKFFLKLKEKYPDIKMTYLSTSVIPLHKMRRIIRLKNNCYQIAVTTQLVEAGVDIDFDVVVRDFAPLDCIVQSAGRCNRNNKISKGEFFLVHFIDDKNKSFAKKVYRSILLDETKHLLQNKTSIKESEIFNLTNEYFKNIKHNHCQNKEVLESIFALNYDNIGKNFSIITDNAGKVSMFVEFDKYATILWEKYKNRTDFSVYKNKFNWYVISMFLTPDEVIELPAQNKDIIKIDKDFVEYFYDELIGFKKIRNNNIFL